MKFDDKKKPDLPEMAAEAPPLPTSVGRGAGRRWPTTPPFGSGSVWQPAGPAPMGPDDFAATCNTARGRWVETRSHLLSKRLAAVDIVIGNGVGLGDKCINQAMHAHWSKDHWEKFGPPPAASTVRHWCAELRRGGRVPQRDYLSRAKPVPRGNAKPSTSMASAEVMAASELIAAATAAAGPLVGKAMTERSLRGTPIVVGDDLPVRPKRGRIVRRRFVEMSGARIGGRVSISGNRFRYLGATVRGKHAFAQGKEDLPADAKPRVTMLDGSFKRGRFHRR